MTRSIAMEETNIEEDVHWLKQTTREIVGKTSFRITHDLGNKKYLYFDLIVPTDNCKLMYENRNDILSANKIDSVDYDV